MKHLQKKTRMRMPDALLPTGGPVDAAVGRCSSAARGGMTLLEVLVACGILVFALSGIAAILPAAGSRLAESVAEDRAAVLSANVFAELKARQFFKASLFNGVPTVSASPNQQSETLAFGNLGPTLDWTGTAADASINAQKQSPSFFTNPLSPSISGTSVFDTIWPYASFKATPENCRGFFLEDDLTFADVNGAPTSQYETTISGTGFGPRMFKRGPTWGATLSLLTTGSNPPSAGTPAELSIAIFKKAADARGIDLDRVIVSNDSLYRLPATGQETIRRTYLKPCSYVLALPIGSSATPPPGAKWFRINSSWTSSSDRVSYIILPAETKDYFDGATKKLCVIGFSNLLRLDVFQVTLE
jgi:type II secretory pathway pseudopilin PulG